MEWGTKRWMQISFLVLNKNMARDSKQTPLAALCLNELIFGGLQLKFRQSCQSHPQKCHHSEKLLLYRNFQGCWLPQGTCLREGVYVPKGLFLVTNQCLPLSCTCSAVVCIHISRDWGKKTHNIHKVNYDKLAPSIWQTYAVRSREWLAWLLKSCFLYQEKKKQKEASWDFKCI